MCKIVTKTVSIGCRVDKAFEYIANGANWTKFAIHNVMSIQPTDDDNLWLIDTPRGKGKLKLLPNKQFGLLDHEFIDAGEGKWTVPARVVPFPGGCHLMMTFVQPEQFPDELFDKGMQLLDEEFAKLREILELEWPNT